MEHSSKAYDLFLSHRGPDTKDFCAFLKEALNRAGVHAFVDELDLQVGAPETAWTTMQDALQGARYTMPVLSQGYMDSCWCLDELVLMMQSSAKVMPIFFGVTPSRDTLVDLLLRGKLKDSSYDKLEAWTTAINEVTTKTGWRSELYANGYAPELVKEVVKGVLEKLGRPALHVADMPIDLEERVAHIKQLFISQPAGSAASVSLHGMGGIGKTTLAKAVFNALQSDFAGSSCFVEVGSETNDAILRQLQSQMLKELCNVDRVISSVAQGTAELQQRLRNSRVLLVIDDIWSSKQRDALLVFVGPGSRVLLTTRNALLLQSSSCSGMLSQPVDVMGRQAAMELFSWSAFLAKEPPARYRELAAKAADACAGLPLTLIVLGAYLWDQPDQASWEAALEKLRSAQSLTGDTTKEDELWGKLWLSYKTLGEAEQEMFLDIACCMLGKRISRALSAWGPGAECTLRNLISRSLVSIVVDDIYSGDAWNITMPQYVTAVHDQLRDMARMIVVMENRRVTVMRSRVWMPDALQVASGKQGMGAVEAFTLEGCDIATAAVIPPTVHLRFLDLGFATLSSSDFGDFSSLAYLEWHAAHAISCLPCTLAALDLSGSRNMKELPAMCGLAVLQHLNLRKCESLAVLPQSLGTLTRLQQLDLSWCTSLAMLPESLGSLTGLQQLGLRGCACFSKLPESLGALTGLRRLDLSECAALAALPQSLSALTGLQHLDFGSCVSLAALPESIGALTGLQHLDLMNCVSLAALPQSIGALTGLQQLLLSECASFTVLPESLGALIGLRQLHLRWCESLARLPESLGQLTGLQELHLGGCPLSSRLLESLGALTGLQQLDLSDCISLAGLPESMGALTQLQQLWLSGCVSLRALPKSLGALTRLQRLDLSGCVSLRTLPESLGALRALHLDLTDTPSLTELPESLRALTGRQKLTRQAEACELFEAMAAEWPEVLEFLQSF